jgi:hypothetical protein
MSNRIGARTQVVSSGQGGRLWHFRSLITAGSISGSGSKKGFMRRA